MDTYGCKQCNSYTYTNAVMDDRREITVSTINFIMHSSSVADPGSPKTYASFGTGSGCGSRTLVH
jgi:hypothetical protein